MSRFWAAGSSSSDDGSGGSDSDSGSGSSDDDNHQEGQLGATGQQEANRWLAMSDDSSDEDSAVRVVLSGKERFQETVKQAIVQLKKAMRARDYYEIQTVFDVLQKSMIKNKQYLSTGVPLPLVRILCELEDYSTERLQDKQQFKTLSARQGRALNRMKLTLKKHNKAYATVMAAYRANPVVSDAEETDEDENDKNDNDASSQSSSSSSSSGSSSGSSSDSSSNSSHAENKKKTKKDSVCITHVRERERLASGTRLLDSSLSPLVGWRFHTH
jgi:translation initiation factor 3 subunit C